MRKILKLFFIFTISGFGLVVGMTLAIFVIHRFNTMEESKPLRNCKPYKNNGEILVEKVVPITVTSSAGVRVSLKNTSETEPLKPSDLSIFIMHEGEILFECGGYGLSSIPSNKLVTEQVLCRQVDRNLLPLDIEYQVTVANYIKANSCGEWRQTIVRD